MHSDFNNLFIVRDVYLLSNNNLYVKLSVFIQQPEEPPEHFESGFVGALQLLSQKKNTRQGTLLF